MDGMTYLRENRCRGFTNVVATNVQADEGGVLEQSFEDRLHAFITEVVHPEVELLQRSIVLEGMADGHTPDGFNEVVAKIQDGQVRATTVDQLPDRSTSSISKFIVGQVCTWLQRL